MSPSDELNELFRRFRRSAWRWECQGDYAVDEAKLQRWRDGLPPDLEAKRPWLDFIRDLTATGKSWQRVRMLTEPLTEYLRWLIEQTQVNIDAGEDIRWIPQRQAVELGMPGYDFYLFDDELVAIMRFGEDRLLRELEVSGDPQVVATHRAYRDTVWPHAIRHTDYHAPSSP
ncbi:hypothetical protein B0I33_111221 [Prauserella shujinwangii]|uniref:DUF6879 domain-containing protein n=1 Tax=Prauserella shujinwangii TaxID=1453103 RepID=A0A2T0LND4_9PSEU|nr:DUF6879 family protein [Prauserella shujinwangii]PRX44707.1 hypothetical protein B0I33_111221 [Prauserella shujinwangii]